MCKIGRETFGTDKVFTEDGGGHLCTSVANMNFPDKIL